MLRTNDHFNKNSPYCLHKQNISHVLPLSEQIRKIRLPTILQEIHYEMKMIGNERINYSITQQQYNDFQFLLIKTSLL